ncbi:hypothetical protein C2E21_4320 [Chlorella sorokiniana]|uniref:Uncharacterized protein n=1 Tax=Chlorella sorokiniana TaxID=3076 RepID=A0A2P6TTJ0_CHLSO|nr:hypothetical protein C2E21_4320 [Chlorella sorokiniana]|eukprot:PRW57387.1 hypothetical protein C2E21_4320 [Chlorella sorokiniana]
MPFSFHSCSPRPPYPHPPPPSPRPPPPLQPVYQVQAQVQTSGLGISCSQWHATAQDAYETAIAEPPPPLRVVKPPPPPRAAKSPPPAALKSPPPVALKSPSPPLPVRPSGNAVLYLVGREGCTSGGFASALCTCGGVPKKRTYEHSWTPVHGWTDPCMRSVALSPAVGSSGLQLWRMVAVTGGRLVPALPLPPALAAKWLQSALPPTITSLQLLRPGAAAMLRVLLAASGWQLSEIEMGEAAAAFAAAAGQRGCAKELAVCCRELLEHSQLIECAPSRTRSRHWRLPPQQADAAAATVAALLGAGEQVLLGWPPARYRGRIQRFAAAVLHTLVPLPPGTAMPTKQLERKAAVAAGEAATPTKNTFSDGLLRPLIAERTWEPSKQYLQRVRRWAAGCLQHLLQSAPGAALRSSELQSAVAAVLGETGRPGIDTACHKVGIDNCWSLPQQARPRAAAIVASAVAAGALPPAVQAAAAPAATAARKRARQTGGEVAAEELDRNPSSSKRHMQGQQQGGTSAAADASVAPTVPLKGSAERSSSLPSVAPKGSPSCQAAAPAAASSGPSTAHAPAAAMDGRRRTLPPAAATAVDQPAAMLSLPAQQPQPSAAGPAAVAAAAPVGALTTLDGAATAGGGGGGGGGSGAAVTTGSVQLLPPQEALEDLLSLPAGDVELLPLAEQLLEVAEWAGVGAAQAAQFGDLIVWLAPSKRLLYYRQLWAATEQQDASKAAAASGAASFAAWPIALSAEVERDLLERHMASEQCRRRIQRYAASILRTLLQLGRAHKGLCQGATQQRAQRWAAAMLHELQSGPLSSQQLAAKAACAAGDPTFDLAHDRGGSPHSLARHLLRHLGIVESSRQPHSPALLWSLASGPGVAGAVTRVVAAAHSAGALQPDAAPQEEEGCPPQQGTSGRKKGKYTWPLRLPGKVVNKGDLRADGSRRALSQEMQARMQRFCAAILQALLSAQSSMSTRAAAGSAAAGGDGPAPQLPPPDDEEVEALLAEAADASSLMEFAELLLDVAAWAGVAVAQSARFGDAFLELGPAKRLLWYRRLWRAASQQDAQGVRQLMAPAGTAMLTWQLKAAVAPEAGEGGPAKQAFSAACKVLKTLGLLASQRPPDEGNTASRSWSIPPAAVAGAAAVVAAAEAAGAFGRAAAAAAEEGGLGGQEEGEGEAREEAVELSSLHWPLLFPSSFVKSYKISAGQQRRTQPWAGGILHVLQSANFAGVFLALRPSARLLWYRQLWRAASQQARARGEKLQTYELATAVKRMGGNKTDLTMHARRLLTSNGLLTSWREGNNPNKPSFWWVPTRQLEAASRLVKQAAIAERLPQSAAQQATAAAAAATDVAWESEDEPGREAEEEEEEEEAAARRRRTRQPRVDEDSKAEDGEGEDEEGDGQEEHEAAWPIPLSTPVLLDLLRGGYTMDQHRKRVQLYLALMLRALLAKPSGRLRTEDLDAAAAGTIKPGDKHTQGICSIARRALQEQGLLVCSSPPGASGAATSHWAQLNGDSMAAAQLVDALSRLAAWAGVNPGQAGAFAMKFVDLAPGTRWLYYNKLREAARLQDPAAVLAWMVPSGAQANLA